MPSKSSIKDAPGYPMAAIEGLRQVRWEHWAALLMALLQGDRRNTLCRVASIRQRVSSGWWWKMRWPLMYALLREMRNLPLRILATHETGIDHLGVHMGCRKTLAHAGRPSNMGSHCRSQDIQSLRDLFPWVTELDLEIFLLGRASGETCAADNSCTGEHIDLALATTNRIFAEEGQ